jgi:GntR family transcriptional regulator/MocR family aminotransferase
MRRLYRQRRDALVAALERHLGRIAAVHGASAGMHLSLQLLDDRLSDVAIAARAREEGLIVNPLSTHAVGAGAGLGWNGLMLGYAQVPAEQMDALVKRLAAVVHLAAYAAGPLAISPADPDRPANRSPSAASSPSARCRA